MPKNSKKFFNIFSKKGVAVSLLFIVCLLLFSPITSNQVVYAVDAPPLSAVAPVVALGPFGIPFAITGWLSDWVGVKLGIGEVGWTGKFGMEVLKGALVGFFMILQALGTILLAATGALLSWVISPDFISLKFTDNQFVNAGWTVVRDFTNMFFILVLVVIGLATALRIQEYAAKKTLPLLIGIALLINFTPVICGVIIDISNIIMNFFLSNVGMGWGAAFDNLAQSWKFFGDAMNQDNLSKIVGYGLAMTFLTFATAFVYLIFAILFIVRYLALWILVILSPLAFFSYILPATRGIWNKWWEQFGQWLIIGVGGAFFLYLSDVMMSQVGNITAPPVGIQEEGIQGLNAISSFFPFLIPVLFLIIGLFATLTTSAIGASYAISGAAKGGRWVGEKGGSRLRETGVGQKAEAWMRKTGEKIPVIGPKPGTYELEEATRRKKYEDKAGTLSPEGRKEALKTGWGKISHAEKLALQKVALEEGELTSQEEEKAISSLRAAKYDLRETYKKRPDWAKDIPEQTGKMTPLELRQKIEKETFDIKPTDDIKTKARKTEVVLSMTSKQWDEIDRRGKEELKGSIVHLVADEDVKNIIGEREADLRKKGRQEEANALNDRIARMKKDPEWAKFAKPEKEKGEKTILEEWGAGGQTKLTKWV